MPYDRHAFGANPFHTGADFVARLGRRGRWEGAPPGSGGWTPSRRGSRCREKTVGAARESADALLILATWTGETRAGAWPGRQRFSRSQPDSPESSGSSARLSPPTTSARADGSTRSRSEEHTSELQSRVDLVCRLLLEK